MTALSSDRNTPTIISNLRSGDVAASHKIYAGAMVMRNATGLLEKGATALNLVGVGRAEKQADNSSGADGDLQVDYRTGTFRFANDGTDTVTAADIGYLCYAVDDQTVAATDGTGTRSKAGIVEMVDDQGVWVSFNEAVTRASI